SQRRARIYSSRQRRRRIRRTSRANPTVRAPGRGPATPSCDRRSTRPSSRRGAARRTSLTDSSSDSAGYFFYDDLTTKGMSLCDLCDYFAFFAFKRDLLNRNARKVVAKVAKGFPFVALIVLHEPR